MAKRTATAKTSQYAFPGAPTLYKPEYCRMLVEHCRTGHSFDSFAGVIEVCRDTLYEWARVHPEFSYAKELAASVALVWIERKSLDAIAGRNEKFHATAWVFTMKNRYGWRDAIDLNVNIDISGALISARERAQQVIEGEIERKLLSTPEVIDDKVLIVDKPVSEPS